MDNSIFRKKSLERISSPESLNDCLHVTSPAVWLILTVVILLLAGMLIWSSVASIGINSQRLAGDILQRKGTNATIAATLVNTLAPLAINVLMMGLYLVFMLRCSVILTIVGIVTILLNLLVS